MNELLGDSKFKGKIVEVNEILSRLRILLPEEARPQANTDLDENSFYSHLTDK
jgi:hypothetical protein